MATTARSPRSGADLQAPPAPRLDMISLFVDLDGTISPLELTPQAVGPDHERRRLLDHLLARLEGRLAVVSGRTLADLDRVLEGRIRSLGAVHGLVRRAADGRIFEAVASPRMAEALNALRAFAASDPALLVEDKGAAAALHYRRHPEAGPASRDLVATLADRLGLAARLGDMVAELRERGPDKGSVVAAFMAEPPFAGHPPVFLGDDLTDEDGFAAAQALGGYGVVVGPRRPTAARYALEDVAQVRAWLAAGLDGPA
ncbi:MAG TPA: trehalose-phosphatase [Caulobacteraceae bacterium]|jgi:trehalose 6-phosphate phosphatase|nr:trehalose-phosphatase [Caulobacteraceae bacterium]